MHSCLCGLKLPSRNMSFHLICSLCSAMDTSKWTILFMTSLDPHWDHTHQWWLVYLGCATSCLAQVLCMVMHWPLSYCPRIGNSHWQSWNKDTFCLCNHSARNRAEDFGKIYSAVFFASARRQGEYIILPPLLVMRNHGCDMSREGPPPFCPGMQTNWMARHDVAGGTCMKLLRKGSTLNLPKQTKDMTSCFLLPYLIGVFLHKSLFSASLQNATKPSCGYPAMRRRCNSRPISCTSQRCFSHQSP